MRPLLLFSALLLILSGRPETARASGFPPLGKRIYLIDQGRLHSPGIIRDDAGKPDKGVKFLKDPIKPKRKAPPRRRQVARRARGPSMLPGKLSFQSIGVSGKVSRPRIRFQEEWVPVDRTDQQRQVDYIGRILRTARQDAGL